MMAHGTAWHQHRSAVDRTLGLGNATERLAPLHRAQNGRASRLGSFLSWMAPLVAIVLLAELNKAVAQPGTWPVKPLRHYTFDDVSLQSPRATDLAGSGQAMTYDSKQPLEVVSGRLPGSKAVRLDAGSFRTATFDVGPKGLTILMWFRKHGQGSELGNGRTNGMLFSAGNGYWEGLRAYCEEPGGLLFFQIGRPQPASAFTLPARQPAPNGVWQALAVTWDRRQMRAYWNGLLVAAADFAGDYTPTNSPFRLGFSDAGIGSLKLDVDELIVFGEALDPLALLAITWERLELTPDAAAGLRQATDAVAAGDWPAALRHYRKLAETAGQQPLLAALARTGAAQALRCLGRSIEMAAQCAAVAEANDVPDVLRVPAARGCIEGQRGVLSAGAPLGVLQWLAGQPGLSATDRIDVWKAVAEAALRAGDAETAREYFGKLAADDSIGEPDRWNFRLQTAHAFLAAKQYQAARQVYGELTAAGQAPEAIRGLAALAAAHTYYRQKNYPAAAEAYTQAAGRTDIPKHHRREAAELAEEMRRLAQGLPRRDAAEGRTVIAPLPRPGVVLHVAPGGEETADGTAERPLGSLAAARDRIRQIRSQRGLPAGGVVVLVHGGEYRLRETWELGREDSGTAASPIVYRAAEGEQPVLTGGVLLRHFTPVTDPAILARLPEPARGNVYQADLRAQGIDDLGSITARGYGCSDYPVRPWVDLYVGRRAMQLARWPNDGFVTVGKVHAGGFRTPDAGKPGRFEYQGDRPDRWRTADDVWMFGYWGHLWAANAVRVAKLDTQQRQITTEHAVGYGFREGMPYYYFNLLEEIDSPGEWYLDRKTGVLYIYPPANARGAIVQLPLLSVPLVKLTDASHVRLQGLSLELGRTDALVIQGGTGVLVAGCTIRQMGGNGLVVHGGNHHGILGCDILTVGAGGLRVAGGDMKTLTPGDHFVENCHVYDFSRVDRVYAPAVHLSGVGNRISHNLFHDSPHHAMRVEGYEHTVAFNEIHSVVYEADDQAGIDMYGDAGYRGNVIRYNFWHHIGSGHNVAGQAGVRLDDFISGVLVYGNVFYRSAGGRFGGLQIHGGKDNTADNNLFVDCTAAVSFSPWGENRWKERLRAGGGPSGTVWHGIDVTRPPHIERYPDLARLEENADRNFLLRNVAVHCGMFTSRERGVNVLLDNVAFAADPGFVDVGKRNFTLPDDSPLFDRLGFRPIPFSEIGLYASPLRASWPVEHSVSPKYHREY